MTITSGLVITAALGVALLASPPASAGPTSTLCSAGFQCVFEASQGTSSKVSFFDSVPDFRMYHFSDGSAVDNNVGFVVNASTTGRESHFYSGSNYVGFLFCVKPGHSASPGPSGKEASSMLLRTPTSIPCF